MPRIAKTVEDVVLGEAAHGTLQQRFEDMVAIFSVIANRSVQLSKSPEDIVSVKRQFNAYNKPLPPGAEHYRDLVKQAKDYVAQNGPVHNATFYATPSAAGRLPRGLAFETSTSGHQYFSDPQGRAIQTASGYVIPNSQPVGIPNAPIPEAAPRNIQNFDAARFGDPIAAQAAPQAFDSGRFAGPVQAPAPAVAFDAGRFGDPAPARTFDTARFGDPAPRSAPVQAQAFDMSRFGDAPRSTQPTQAFDPGRFGDPNPPTASIQPSATKQSGQGNSYLMSAPEVTKGSQRINNEAKSPAHPQPVDAVRNAMVWANESNARADKAKAAQQAVATAAPARPPGFRPSSQDVVPTPAKSLQHPQDPRAFQDAIVYANEANARADKAKAAKAVAAIATAQAPSLSASALPAPVSLAASQKSSRAAPSQVASLAPTASPASPPNVAAAYKQASDSLQAMGQLNLSGNKTASMSLDTGDKREPIYAPTGEIYAPAGSGKKNGLTEPTLSAPAKTPGYVDPYVTTANNPSRSPKTSRNPEQQAAPQTFDPARFGDQLQSYAPISQWSGHTGADVWSGIADQGTATDGSRLARQPDGSVGRYVSKFDHTEYTNADGTFGGLKKGDWITNQQAGVKSLQQQQQEQGNARDANGNWTHVDPMTGETVSGKAPTSNGFADFMSSLFNPGNIAQAATTVGGAMLGGGAGATVGGKVGGKIADAMNGGAPRKGVIETVTAAAKGYPPAPTPAGSKTYQTNSKAAAAANQKAAPANNAAPASKGFDLGGFFSSIFS